MRSKGGSRRSIGVSENDEFFASGSRSDDTLFDEVSAKLAVVPAFYWSFGRIVLENVLGLAGFGSCVGTSRVPVGTDLVKKFFAG